MVSDHGSEHCLAHPDQIIPRIIILLEATIVLKLRSTNDSAAKKLVWWPVSNKRLATETRLKNV